MDFKNVSKKYRPIPFWSWNEKLGIEETKEQIQKMDKAGLGGFFMHARGGLQTEYMGDEWFHNVTASVETAKECGMRAWAYDENGWPSGFGNGVVNGLGAEYQQKYLRMEDKNTHEETAICKCGAHYFYYDINPFYVDTLDKDVIAKFIEYAYQPYYEKYGNEIEGFFTDEPQISRNGIPWSFVFEEEYQKRYRENILEHLEELFLPVHDYKNTRVKFWKMVTDLFSENYMKQIFDWCSERGLKLTGHLLLEESLNSQLITNGACMPHYEYFHIPGVDWLGKDIQSCLTAMQVSSVAEQLGKEAVLTESFACCGHNISFAELKGLYEWQMVRGVNLLCQHLEGYSLRGIRKRDYPPAMYLQQPWWCEYDKFNEALSRESMLLREGENVVDVLVLHPQTTAWTLFDNGENKGLRELKQDLLDTMNKLETKHIAYHLGDETIMERHAYVNNGRIIIGKQKYSRVICSECEVLLESTQDILKEFKQTGGKIITADEIPTNKVIDNARITYANRDFPEFQVHFFVNSSPNRETGKFTIAGKVLDIYSGELKKFTGAHEFEPWGSLMVIEEKNGPVTLQNEEPDIEATLIRPQGMYQVKADTMNTLTLDTCDYYFDGVLQEENGYVLNICERANKLERMVAIHQDYHIQADYIPSKLYLVCETPEKFKISINGTIVEKKAEGYFADKSFEKIEIASYLKEGKNTISFDCDFVQSHQFYEGLKRAYVFEGERNKLAYDFEIEPIYLLGEFSLKTEGKWTNLEKDAVRYQGDFVIDKPRTQIDVRHIEKQGYPFFCGSLVLEGEIDIQGENPVLDIEWKGINALKVEINGKEKVMLTDNRLALKEFGAEGITKVTFTLTNNLRNLIGPHHLEVGESHRVGPYVFYKESCVWNYNRIAPWTEGYCFVEMGI